MEETTKKSYKKLLIVIFVVLIILSIIILFVFTRESKNNQASITPTPTINKNATSTLKLSPNPALVSTGSGTIQVVLTPNNNKVTAVQLEILFNPQVVNITEVNKGTLAQNPIVLLNNIDSQKGLITYALGIAPNQSPITQSGTIAEISFTLIDQDKQAVLSFAPTTQITAVGENGSVLKSSSGTEIRIVEGGVKSAPAVIAQ